MDQITDLADGRLLGGCTYCDHGDEGTRDHVPSRIFLDAPFPTNLPVVPACRACNNRFSRDEEYLACLVECAIADTTDPDSVPRPRVAEVLRRSSALRARLDNARRVIDGQIAYEAEGARVETVLTKLARGHASYELSARLLEPPNSLMWWPLSIMTPEQREAYDAPLPVEIFPELGSRGMQRIAVTQVTLSAQSGQMKSLGVLLNDWIDVQEDRYRYLASDTIDGIRIRIVIREFLASEISWEKG